MLSIFEKILSPFSKCFSRNKPFCFFCLVIISFMMLTNDSGVTSFIRILFLDPKIYECLLKFFNADSYDLKSINQKWFNIVENSSQALLFENRCVLIGDHTKVSKEGRRMPAVKRHHQESEDLGKPENIYGHHYGMIGILISRAKQVFCVPLHLRIHEGTEQIAYWEGEKPLSRCERLIKEAISICKNSCHDLYLVLDRDFLNKKGLLAILDHNLSSKNKIDIIGRCKNNVTCRRKLTRAEKEKDRARKKRGRPRIYSRPVKPVNWFEEFKDQFKEVQRSDGSTIKLFSRIEYWHDLKLKFVLLIDQEKQLIFYTTDLNLSSLKVIELYKMRFFIETTFYSLKHIVHGFSYHFWVKGFPKLDKFSTDRLENISDHLKQRVIKCIERTERLVNFAGIALGVLQFMALEAGLEYSPKEICYQRTYRHEDQISIEQFQVLFSGIFAILLGQNPDSLINKIIRPFVKT